MLIRGRTSDGSLMVGFVIRMVTLCSSLQIAAAVQLAPRDMPDLRGAHDRRGLLAELVTLVRLGLPERRLGLH
ncbi:hypothetical protein C1X35_32440 [Pseudomonas sp. FW306-1C-G01A]|nr:hypothetical protein [Pseudomonas sp.]MSU92911.1 hypothetical protein [Pseudomonas mandelii]PMV78526.1 hypothetical protein C1X56_32455 [Pseudomonas sp. GW101-1A09]PMV83046.1 hypothetical protein C1X51_32280 [Pseudomonas sp. FW306-2-2C-B10A]PMV88716.1 hypothetical protein C1X55_33585 [Pseudomonas sp. GW460-C8]PMV95168.1 hypothetical protein C1X50_32335 [Pseudomonas sp. MPR-TSA4]PMW04673.1 hypothetical protein C1X52_32180 [Pseudomonas sp. FW306-2-1A-C05A]PMW09124.1 hypothetical protein C1X